MLSQTVYISIACLFQCRLDKREIKYESGCIGQHGAAAPKCIHFCTDLLSECINFLTECQVLINNDAKILSTR